MSALSEPRRACSHDAISHSPTIRFSGVRSSWLTTERKRLFNSLAASASLRACSTSSYSRTLIRALLIWLRSAS